MVSIWKYCKMTDIWCLIVRCLKLIQGDMMDSPSIYHSDLRLCVLNRGECFYDDPTVLWYPSHFQFWLVKPRTHSLFLLANSPVCAVTSRQCGFTTRKEETQLQWICEYNQAYFVEKWDSLYTRFTALLLGFCSWVCGNYCLVSRRIDAAWHTCSSTQNTEWVS